LPTFHNKVFVHDCKCTTTVLVKTIGNYQLLEMGQFTEISYNNFAYCCFSYAFLSTTKVTPLPTYHNQYQINFHIEIYKKLT